MSRTSIQDVAREAGVAASTVSHVFSGKRTVAPIIRRRVFSVAERLDYRPSTAPSIAATSFDVALLRGLADQYEHQGRRHMAGALRRGADALDRGGVDPEPWPLPTPDSNGEPPPTPLPGEPEIPGWRR